MTSPYLQLPLRGLEDVLSSRRAEGSPLPILVGMPETPEAAALCLLVMLLDRRGEAAAASETEILDLYRQCIRAANGRWGETEPASWRQ